MIQKAELETLVAHPGEKIVAENDCDSYWARIQLLSGLADAYLRQTGLVASQVRLVQETHEGKTVFYFIPASGSGDPG